MVILLKVGFSPELLVHPSNPIGGSLRSRGARVQVVEASTALCLQEELCLEPQVCPGLI